VYVDVVVNRAKEDEEVFMATVRYGFVGAFWGVCIGLSLGWLYFRPLPWELPVLCGAMGFSSFILAVKIFRVAYRRFKYPLGWKLMEFICGAFIYSLIHILIIKRGFTPGPIEWEYAKWVPLAVIAFPVASLVRKMRREHRYFPSGGSLTAPMPIITAIMLMTDGGIFLPLTGAFLLLGSYKNWVSWGIPFNKRWHGLRVFDIENALSVFIAAGIRYIYLGGF